MQKLLQEFKTFAMKGNVVDMAVGVIIGGAFGKIVTSLVSDIFMPLIGLLVGGVDFTQWKIVLSQANEAAGKAEVAITYGNFIQVVLDFIILAWVIFMVIKGINKLNAKKEKEAEKPAEPAPTPEDILLLREIRDSLKK
ncbi:MAG: large-conductance mechanosensitive channel protein MscL [Bacteroidales bacterium]|nr:large-conductance mechanosensitive channel protein MscL [Bacteroidales bacterium]